MPVTIPAPPVGRRTPWCLDGRRVLLLFCGFFGVIFAMNAVFLYLAFSTFGGIEDAGAYRANFLIGKEAAAASKQDRLGWKVTGAFQRRKGGRASLMISATGRSGEPVAIRSVDVELRRPGKRQLDRKLPLTRTAPGRYAGDFAGIAPGQWLVSIRLHGTGGELFESRNRVILK